MGVQWKQIAVNFTELVSSTSFMRLSVASVCRLLSRDDLVING